MTHRDEGVVQGVSRAVRRALVSRCLWVCGVVYCVGVSQDDGCVVWCVVLVSVCCLGVGVLCGCRRNTRLVSRKTCVAVLLC